MRCHTEPRLDPQLSCVHSHHLVFEHVPSSTWNVFPLHPLPGFCKTVFYSISISLLRSFPECLAQCLTPWSALINVGQHGQACEDWEHRGFPSTQLPTGRRKTAGGLENPPSPESRSKGKQHQCSKTSLQGSH